MSAWQAWFSRLFPQPAPPADDADHQRQVLESIGLLSIEEWLLLTYCVQRRRQTIALDVVHPAAGALVAKGLLLREGTINHGAAWPYTVPAYVWRHLLAEPDMLHRLRGIPPDDPELEANLARLDQYLQRFDAN